MDAEGWYLDPFGVHEQRWFSVGRATRLVRDGLTEAQDDPPSGGYAGALTRAPEVEGDASDLRRADEATSDADAVTQEDVVDAAIRVSLNPWDGPL